MACVQGLVLRYYDFAQNILPFLQEARVIGAGGFGKVYKGCINGQEVAIKMVSARRTGEAHPQRVRAAVETLLQELSTVSRLQQETQYIVRLFGFSHHPDGTVCLVYEYANMGCLMCIPDELDLPAALVLFSQYARGLACMHAKRTLHGDLKPQNLLLHKEVDGSYVGRIGDLGLSQIVFPGSTAGLQHGGTRGFIAPELPKTRRSTYMSDVYAFGVAMGSLLSGMKPDKLVAAANTVNSPNYGALARRTAVLEVEGKVYAEFEDVPPGARIVRVLISLVFACCSVMPESRPPAAEVAARLEEIARLGNHDGC